MKMIANLKSFISNNHFMKSISILAAGTALSQLFLLLTTPILTHLYSPEEFGIFSIYLSILYSVSVIASLMYDQAVPLPKDEQEAWDTLMLSLIIVIFMSVFVLIAAWILPIGEWLDAPELEHYAWLLAFSVFGIGWFQALNSWNIRTEDYLSISKSKINMNSGQMVSQITFGIFQTGILGLLAGEVIGRISGFLTLLRFIFKNKPHVRLFCLNGLKKVFIRYKNFPLLSSWSALINVSGTHMPAVFLAVHYGPAVAGWYLLAEKILTVPEALLGYSAKQVYMSQSAKLSTKGRELNALFWMIVKRMSILSLVIIGLIFLIVPSIIPFLFGEAWKEAGKYVQIISILYFMKMVVNPISGNFYALESQNYQMISEGIRFFFICLSMILSFFYIENPTTAIFCISILTSIGYLTNGFFSWYVMKIRFPNEDKPLHSNESR
ncbi:lipopolysaccharide biosynthesis protein [Heyndrickxia vini]|uniref:Oligosaccharide flippase family protein n=1 Tax=Heyndrickxia vini TaxID=1476025 RepID=A0ABX7DY59_9BACI|nr:oligosaccharide flippase family protein [Heyndrickxia vini]QQZ07865.1 oligosaccharide flippase family protein [Heyndrickxia vini]